MSQLTRQTLVLACLAGASFLSHGQALPEPTRGQMLYATHCIGCHTTQMHWRNATQAYDWDSLRMQVRRWQGNASLQWGEADITEVARHLNDTIYRYPQTSNRVSATSLKPSH